MVINNVELNVLSSFLPFFFHFFPRMNIHPLYANLNTFHGKRGALLLKHRWAQLNVCQHERRRDSKILSELIVICEMELFYFSCC